jgi:hypothetical protein
MSSLRITELSKYFCSASRPCSRAEEPGGSDGGDDVIGA